MVDPEPSTSHRPGGPRRATSDWLAEELVELIRGQSLQPGQRLPPVSVLAERYQVAPPTAREALRRLQALGLIDMRHGSGIYVLGDPDRFIMANPYPGQLKARVVLDLLDARLLIEPYLASLAASRVREDPPEDVEAVMVQALAPPSREHLATGGVLSQEHLNLAVHRAVASLSGNMVLAQTVESVLDFYAAEHVLVKSLADPVSDRREHEAVVAAVLQAKPDLAAKRMRRHLEEIRRLLSDRVEKAPVKSR